MDRRALSKQTPNKGTTSNVITTAAMDSINYVPLDATHSTAGISSADRVFGITELCEQILSTLSPGRLMLMRKFCSSVRDIIDGSPILQQKLSLKPARPSQDCQFVLAYRTEKPTLLGGPAAQAFKEEVEVQRAETSRCRPSHETTWTYRSHPAYTVNPFIAEPYTHFAGEDVKTRIENFRPCSHIIQCMQLKSEAQLSG
jgi:hypothetical protein